MKREINVNLWLDFCGNQSCAQFCALDQYLIKGSTLMTLRLIPRAFRLGTLLAGAFAGWLAIGQAQATIITYQLTSDHCTGGCLGGLTSLGTVTVNDAGGNLAFSVD